MSKTVQFLLCMFLSNCFTGQTVHKSVLCNVVSSGAPGPETSAKFAVAVPGSQVSGLSVVPSEGNRRVFILLDSGGGNGKSNASLNLTMQVVRDFIAGSPLEQQLALVDFADKVYFDIPFQRAETFAKQFADPKVTGKIKPLGPTVLFDAISNAADYLHNSAAEGDSIFVISDGFDNGSTRSRKEAERALARDNIRAYLLLTSTPSSDKKRKQLQPTLDLVRNSGGFVVGVPALEWAAMSTAVPMPRYELRKIERGKIQNDLRTLHQHIENAYRLEFDLQPVVNDSRPLEVSSLSPDGMVATDRRALCPATIEP